MDLINDVFTARDLPESAELWGRETEDNLVNGAREDSALGGQLQNMQRAVGGGLSVVSLNIVELSARRTVSHNIPDVTMLVTAPPIPSTPTAFAVSKDMVFQAPDDKPRTCVVTVGTTLYSSTPTVSADVSFYVEYAGKTYSATQGIVPQMASRPGAEWFSSNAFTFVITTKGESPMLRFRAGGTASAPFGGAPEASKVGATNVLAQVTFGAVVQ